MTTPTPEELPGLGISADQLNTLMSAIELIGQMMSGYRAKLIAAGFGDETADRMSEAFHTQLMEQLRAKAAATQPAGPNRQERRHGR